MAGRISTFLSIIVACLAVLAYLVGPKVHRTFTVFGAFRSPSDTPFTAEELVVIEDTTLCEDIHFHAPSQLLFTACEDSTDTRKSWFPPLGNLHDPLAGQGGRGSIHVIDPKSMTSKRLLFEDFNGPFVTHGIDVISDPDRPDGAVYIFAVNHLPHPEFLKARADQNASGGEQVVAKKTRSQIEIFYHILGANSAKHMRSVQHPLIATPNDVFAKGPRSIYVTNDHYYPEGWKRLLEDVYYGAKWSNTVHLRIDDLASPTATDGIKVEVALAGMRGNNGLAHAKPGQILITSCSDGIVHVGELSADPEITGIKLVDSFDVDTFIDNPSWFEDPFRSESYDASGLVVAGMPKAIDLPKYVHKVSGNLGSAVWYAKQRKQCDSQKRAGCWETRLLFEDDGSTIRAASGAVLVAIDPAKENGQRKAWLFVTSFFGSNVVAVKVDI